MKYSDFNLLWAYGFVPDGEPIYWFIHPARRDYCSVAKWKEAVDDIAAEKGTLIISKVYPGIPVELNDSDSIEKLICEDRAYLGRWQLLLGRKKDVIDAFKRTNHVIFGQMVDDCVLNHVEDLLKFIPSDKIHLLSEYSFSKTPLKDLETVLDLYKEKGVDVFSGRCEELVLND